MPGATTCTADVPFPKTTLLAVREVAPVPPLATGSVPVTAVVKLMLVTVLLLPLIVLFVSASTDTKLTKVELAPFGSSISFVTASE